MYEEERQLYCPAILEIKSLQNFFSSIGDTAVHTGSGPRSLKTKQHNQRELLKAAEGGVYPGAMMQICFSSKTISMFLNELVLRYNK